VTVRVIHDGSLFRRGTAHGLPPAAGDARHGCIGSAPPGPDHPVTPQSPEEQPLFDLHRQVQAA
jgi:hypothetical protein